MKYQKSGNLSLFISYYWQKTFNSLSISCKWKLNVYIIITCSDYWYMEVIEILCKIIVAFNIFLWIFTFTELLLLHFYSRNTMTKPASIYIYIYIYVYIYVYMYIYTYIYIYIYIPTKFNVFQIWVLSRQPPFLMRG